MSHVLEPDSAGLDSTVSDRASLPDASDDDLQLEPVEKRRAVPGDGHDGHDGDVAVPPLTVPASPSYVRSASAQACANVDCAT